MQKFLLLSTDLACKLAPKTWQKRACNVYVFRLSFHFAYHHWWLGILLAKKILLLLLPNGGYSQTLGIAKPVDFLCCIFSELTVPSYYLHLHSLRRRRRRRRRRRSHRYQYSINSSPPSFLCFPLNEQGSKRFKKIFVCLFVCLLVYKALRSRNQFKITTKSRHMYWKQFFFTKRTMILARHAHGETENSSPPFPNTLGASINLVRDMCVCVCVWRRFARCKKSHFYK